MTMQPPPRLLIPRARPQAEAFAEALEAAHPGLCHPVIAPLIDIRQSDTMPDPDGADGLIFTSANGVAAFCRLSQRRDLPVWCVGGQTAARATAAGFGVELATASVAALVPVLPGDKRFFYPRGAHVSRDLAADPALAGRVTDAVVYDQVPLPLESGIRTALVAGEFGGVALLSPRSAALLIRALAPATLPPETTLFCLSPAIAEAASALGGGTRVATSPDSPGLIALIGTSFMR